MIQPSLPDKEASSTEHAALAASFDTTWIADLGLSPAVLEHLLNNFRGMSAYFPFVHLPEHLTAESIVKDRPFLLLAAVTNGASKYQHLQAALIEKFKTVLSQNLIIAGEKDLDLLQGLLVHLAWYDVPLYPVIAVETYGRGLMNRIPGFISTSTHGALKHTATYKSQSVWSLTSA
jgi:hypothetical protein